jgi:hypothetical protein
MARSPLIFGLRSALVTPLSSSQLCDSLFVPVLGNCQKGHWYPKKSNFIDSSS